MPLRLIFMGTPEFAVPTLLALAKVQYKAGKAQRRATEGEAA